MLLFLLSEIPAIPPKQFIANKEARLIQFFMNTVSFDSVSDAKRPTIPPASHAIADNSPPVSQS